MTQKEKELIIQEKKWERDKKYLERKNKLKQEKRNFILSNSFFKLSTSKFLILFLFINCTLIELFTGYVTIRSLDLATMTMMTPDFTPLVTLIGSVVSEVVGFAIYGYKSAKENQKNGIVYETTMMELKEKYNSNNEEALG